MAGYYDWAERVDKDLNLLLKDSNWLREVDMKFDMAVQEFQNSVRKQLEKTTAENNLRKQQQQQQLQNQQQAGVAKAKFAPPPGLSAEPDQGAPMVKTASRPPPGLAPPPGLEME